MVELFKRSFIKPDGRNLTLYSRAPIPEQIVSTNPHHEPFQSKPRLRWHPLRREWVAYASHRQDRTFLPPKEFNPLAPTLDPKNPTELPRGEYDIAVFDNLFASLIPQSSVEHIEPINEFVPAIPANGQCEVVVFTQDPESSLAQLEPPHFELLMKVWGDRFVELEAKNKDLKYILAFENRGVEVGVTLHHPHGQIYAYPFVPPLQQTMIETQISHYQTYGTTLIADLLREEKSAQVRLVCESEFATAFVPPFARYPYEVWVVPHRPVQHLAELEPLELKSFAETLQIVIRKFDKLWDQPFPYLMAFYPRPSDEADYQSWHFHIEIYPAYRTRGKLKYLAGTEIAAGMFVNDSLPEEKARELREVTIE